MGIYHFLKCIFIYGLREKRQNKADWKESEEIKGQIG